MVIKILFFLMATMPPMSKLSNSSQLECQRNPCIHGVCKPSVNGSECFCENGYTGYHCETNYDDCVSFPCQNRGTCIDLVAGVECFCPQGFTGSFCESLLDHCSSHPCLNGGTCHDYQNGFNCSCAIGFNGEVCEIDLDVCDPLDSQFQCFNGGTCIEGVGMSFTCSCISGFEGPRCESNVNECLSQPCQNNGTCMDQLDGFICICPCGWIGTYCELEQELCDPELCTNQGLCIGNDTEHQCYCIPDFHGSRCQWQYDECIPKPRCHNGGTCFDGVDEYTCICPSEYTGKYCEMLCNVSSDCSTPDVGTSEGFDPMDSWTTVMHPFSSSQDLHSESQWIVTTLFSEIKVESTVDSSYSSSISHEFWASEFESQTSDVQLLTPSSWYSFTNLWSLVQSDLNTKSVHVTPKSDSISYSFSSVLFPSFSSSLEITPEYPTSDGGPYWLTSFALESPSLRTSLWDLPESSYPTVISESSEHDNWASSSFEHSQSILEYSWPSVDELSPEASDAQTPKGSRYPTASSEFYSSPHDFPWPSSGTVYQDFSIGHHPANSSYRATSFMESSQIFRESSWPYSETFYPGASVVDEYSSNFSSIFTAMTLTVNADLDSLLSTSDIFRTSGVTTEVSSMGYFSHLWWPESWSHDPASFLSSPHFTDWHDYSNSLRSFDNSFTFSPTPLPSMEFPSSLSDFWTPKPPETSETMSLWTQTFIPSHAMTSLTISSTPTVFTSPLPYHQVYNGCDNTTCRNNGICQTISVSDKDVVSFKCLCQLYFSGPYCEDVLQSIKIPSFDGSSYLNYNLTNILNTTGDFKMQLTFESVADNGIIFYIDYTSYNCQDMFLMLEIEDGLTILSFSCGSQNVVSMEEGLRVDDGAQHTITVGMQWYQNEDRRMICNVSMQLDQWPPMTGQQHDVATLCDVSVLHLGSVRGKISEELNGKIGFTGCISAVLVNGHILNLVAGAFEGINILECSGAICATGNCRHGAACRNTSATEIVCKCPEGFTGQFCERPVCQPDWCRSGSTCLLLRWEGDDQMQFICLCPLGYQGLHCDQAIVDTIGDMSFSGSLMGYSSFVAFPFPPHSKNCFMLKLEFVPSKGSLGNELLFFVGQAGLHLPNSKFIAGGLIDGRVILEYDFGFDRHLLKSKITIKNDGSAYWVTAGFDGSRVWMKIDNHTSSAIVTNPVGCEDLFHAYIYIGGHQAYNFTQFPPKFSFLEGFNGCITALQLNGKNITELKMDDKDMFGRNIHQCARNKCFHIRCQNGGTCTNVGGNFICICPPGWFGTLCSSPYDPSEDCSHHCSAHANCITHEDGYRCDCPLGWTGIHCDLGLNFSVPYFNGINSYLTFLPQNIRHRLVLTIQFQSLSLDGLLFYTAVKLSEGTSDFATLILDEGHVEFRYNLGGGQFSTAVLRSPNKITSFDPAWHTAHVWQRGKDAVLSFDGQNVTTSTLTGMIALDIATNFYLGGLPNMQFIAKSASEKVLVPFHGCIRNFSINGISYPLTTQGAASGQNIGECGSPTSGFFNRCANGGTCIPVPQGNCQCNCVQPYTGPDCLDILPCHLHVCQNGATCVPIESSDVLLQYELAYFCDCPLHWMGQYCDQPTVSIADAQFQGNGYILVADDSYALSDHTRNRIALNFSTTTESGLLLWTGVESNFDDDYLAIGLEKGRLKVAWNFGWLSRSQLVMPLSSHEESLADSKWHAVVVYREKQKLSVKVDDMVISAGSPGHYTELNTLGLYYIGGLPRGANITAWTNGHFHSGFSGCLNNVELSESKLAIGFNEAISGSNILQC